MNPFGAVAVGAVASGMALTVLADPLDRWSEALTFSFFNQQVRGRVSGMADAEFYHFDRPAPGLIDTTSDALFNPRLALFLDVQAGPRVYVFAQARVNRGFDPGDRPIDARLDEYALRVTPWDDGRLSIQAGQFATVIGNWVERHLSWDNPFITAPVPYEHLTAINDTEAPASISEFIAVDPAEAYEHNPVLWGPIYATGASVAGRIEKFEYAVEVKNSGPSSRPESWTVDDVGFEHPSIAGRMGYRPDLRWNLGFSGGVGPYFRPEAAVTLPPGRNVGDFRQFLIGQDLRFAWRHFQIWAEVWESRFEIPRLGDADTLAYYIETKYKMTPRLFGALRWNQQFFSRFNDPTGHSVRWGDDVSRIDAGFGFRFTAHAQLKLQYSLQYLRPADDWSDLIAAQFTVRF